MNVCCCGWLEWHVLECSCRFQYVVMRNSGSQCSQLRVMYVHCAPLHSTVVCLRVLDTSPASRSSERCCFSGMDRECSTYGPLSSRQSLVVANTVVLCVFLSFKCCRPCGTSWRKQSHGMMVLRSERQISLIQVFSAIVLGIGRLCLCQHAR